MSIPRPEYPRPQFARADWLCLNGTWQFEIDHGDSGLARGLRDAELADHIVVPFCPESELSGIGNVDFLEAVWYRRTIRIPAEWAGQHVLVHFQAVDHDTTVWANGTEVARHRGGWTPFTADLRGIAGPGDEVTLVVRARDPRKGVQARGKQSDRYENYACSYTRTTGIWQTVWLEPVPETYLLRPRITPDVAGGTFQLELPVSGPRRGLSVRATLSDGGSGPVSSTEIRADLDFSVRLNLPVPADRRRLWSTTDPFLYDLLLEIVDGDGNVVDRVQSYAGLRSVVIDGKAILLNGEPVFQRLVLDQGYYPDGIMTAPSEAALIEDIELSIAAGFNGARLHQKVFEERFLYHCDRLGYLVWGEFGDWGARVDEAAELLPGATFVTQWLEAVERDYSHPAIVGWCALNETWQKLHDRIAILDDVTRGMFLAAKAADLTRPVLDASGYSHRVAETDVWDSHNYEQDPAKFAEAMSGLAEGKPYANGSEPGWSLPYAGQPYFCSEFGGIWWNPKAAADEYSWGYGERPKSIEEFYTRFEGLVAVLLDDPNMFGYCYTQLTDVFQEQNGIYGFDRSQKFDLERLRAAQTRAAAIETGT